MTTFAAIIVGIDGWEQYTLPLIESLQEHEPSCSITVVDNASNTPYGLLMADDEDRFAAWRTKRVCYSAAINYGKFVSIDADWYIVLSNDVICTGPFAHLLEPQGDVVAGPCLRTNDLATYIEGWCMCVPRKVWDALGGMDENYEGSDWEDVDLSVSSNEHGFPLCSMPELPFTHLDQRQRYHIVEDFAGKDASNRAYFIQKHITPVAKPSATVSHAITEKSLCIHDIQIGDISLMIQDYSVSLTTAFVLRELGADIYKLNGRTFEDGSVILDIGANVGIVSIWLAKQLPNCMIIAYEPLPVNFDNLCRNIQLNEVSNVLAVNEAVTADGRPLTMHYNYDNLGGASGMTGLPPYNTVDVPSVTLQQVFDLCAIDRCAYLKMDCEGAEHEILASAGPLLDRIDFLGMEAHFSQGLRRKGYNEATLQRALRPLIDRQAVAVVAQEVPG